MQWRHAVTVAVLGTLAAAPPVAPAAHKPKANDCSDAYWVDTLRCQYALPGEAPQPNLGDEPADPSQVRPFTRVFLTREPSIRSVDGTYPVLYVDKAVCTDEDGCGEVPYLGPIESDKWLITVPGGGACFESSCLDFYAKPAERDEMGTAADPPMKTLTGIHSASAVGNPEFAGYNRVRVEKSTYDRYMGRTTSEQGGLRIFNHGFLLMEEAMRRLRNGLQYDTWKAIDGEVVEVRERLPHLAKAEQVVFVGHSGGSHGLVHNIDRYVAILERFGGFEADVRAIFDENFVPGIQNESAFAPPGSGNAYADVWSGVTSADGVSFAYDGLATLTAGVHTEQYLAWDAPMDASCLEHHAATDGATWKCNERQHVVLNHVDTPFFLKQDFTDPNAEHNDRPNGHNPVWGVDGINYTENEFASRVMAQARALIELSATHSEPAALGRSLPMFYVWIGNCGTHAGVYEDEVYRGTRIDYRGTSHTLREWVERFAQAAPDGPSEFRIHRYGEPDPLAATPPVGPHPMISVCE